MSNDIAGRGGIAANRDVIRPIQKNPVRRISHCRGTIGSKADNRAGHGASIATIDKQADIIGVMIIARDQHIVDCDVIGFNLDSRFLTAF